MIFHLGITHGPRNLAYVVAALNETLLVLLPKLAIEHKHGCCAIKYIEQIPFVPQAGEFIAVIPQYQGPTTQSRYTSSQRGRPYGYPTWNFETRSGTELVAVPSKLSAMVAEFNAPVNDAACHKFLRLELRVTFTFPFLKPRLRQPIIPDSSGEQ